MWLSRGVLTCVFVMETREQWRGLGPILFAAPQEKKNFPNHLLLTPRVATFFIANPRSLYSVISLFFKANIVLIRSECCYIIFLCILCSLCSTVSSASVRTAQWISPILNTKPFLRQVGLRHSVHPHLFKNGCCEPGPDSLIHSLTKSVQSIKQSISNHPLACTKTFL